MVRTVVFSGTNVRERVEIGENEGNNGTPVRAATWLAGPRAVSIRDTWSSMLQKGSPPCTVMEGGVL